MNDGSNSRWSNPCGPRASLLQCRLSWKVKDSKVDARRHDQCNFMNYGSKNQWSNPLWVKGQRFNSAKASGPSLLLTVNLHRYLRREDYSLVKHMTSFISHHLLTIPDLMMTSWKMARIVDSPTLEDRGLHYSNVLFADRSKTPR